MEEKAGESSGARGDCSDKLLMTVGLTVKVTFEQKSEEGRELVMPTSGRRAVQMMSVAARCELEEGEGIRSEREEGFVGCWES